MYNMFNNLFSLWDIEHRHKQLSEPLLKKKPKEEKFTVTTYKYDSNGGLLVEEVETFYKKYENYVETKPNFYKR